MACSEIVSFETKLFLYPKTFPERQLVVPQELPFSTDSAQIDPDCIPITVAQPYPHLSKVFDFTLNDKALKI